MKNVRLKIDELFLSVGDFIEYVYDFGDDIQHMIRLEEIKEPKERVRYPRIVSKYHPPEKHGAKNPTQMKITDLYHYE